jgi:hypothetical protein
MEFSRLFIGILNEYDLIASKLIRGSGVDYYDCLMLLKSRRDKINLSRLESHYRELVSYDISQDRVGNNIDHFFELLREENPHD